MLLDSFIENAQLVSGAKILVEESAASTPSVLDEVEFTPLDKYTGIGEGFADAINSMNANFSDMMLGVAYMESYAYRKNVGNVIERAFSEATTLEEAREMLTAEGAFDLVAEASDIKTLKDGVIAWFKKAWEKLQAAFKNAIDKIKGLVGGADQVISNYEAAAAKDKGLGNKVVGKVTLISVGKKNLGSEFPNYIAQITKGFDSVIEDLEKTRGYKELAKANPIKDVAGYDAWLSANGDKAIKGFSAEEKAEYFAKSEAMEITGAQAYKAVKAGKGDVVAAIERSRDRAKKVYDEAIKSLEKLAGDNTGDSTTAQKAQQYVSKKISIHKAMATVVAQASREACIAANHNYSAFLSALRRSIGASKNGAKDTSGLETKKKASVLDKGKAAMGVGGKEVKDRVEQSKKEESINASAGLAALMVH